MNNTLHTPAPWLRSKSGNQFQIVAGSDLNGEPNELIATIHPIAHNCEYEPCDETKSNARLIAAAPDLLSALENLMARCVKDAEHYAPDGNEPIWAFISDASDAIAKAKGAA